MSDYGAEARNDNKFDGPECEDPKKCPVVEYGEEYDGGDWPEPVEAPLIVEKHPLGSEYNVPLFYGYGAVTVTQFIVGILL